MGRRTDRFVSFRFFFFSLADGTCSSVIIIATRFSHRQSPRPACVSRCTPLPLPLSLSLPFIACVLYVEISFPPFVFVREEGGVIENPSPQSHLNVVEADSLEWEKSKRFMVVVATFVLTLFANMKSIQHAPVDTFICLRSTSPLILAGLDYLFLGRELPSRRSFVSLLGIMFGVLMYVNHDYKFSVQAYLWITVWYVVSIFELIYVKHLVSTSNMTTWGQTYYQNVLSVPFLAIMFIALDETRILAETTWTNGCVIALLLSCVAGLGMSFLSFLLRNMISATAFAIVGNMCKVATIFVNTVIWDQHSSPMGIAALMLCLGSGALYSQAPLRSTTYQEREICPCLSRVVYRQLENAMSGVLGKIVMIVPIVILGTAISWALYKDRIEPQAVGVDPFAKDKNNPFEEKGRTL